MVYIDEIILVNHVKWRAFIDADGKIIVQVWQCWR